MMISITPLFNAILEKRYVLILLISALLSSPLALAANNQDQLRELKEQLHQANADLRKSKVRYETLEIERNASQSKLLTIKASVDEERKKLKDLRTAEEQFPNIDFTDQLNKQRGVWQKANRNYLTNSAFVKALDDKISDSRANYDINLRKQKSIQDSINDLSDRLAGSKLQDQLKNLRHSKRIEVSVRETCSLTVTKDKCRDQARVKAERNASEKGAVVVIESVTEVKNFNLSKDEVRSKVKARISDIRVIKDSYDLTADKTGWVIDYAISALVTPSVTEEMIADLKNQIIQNLDSDLGTPTLNPAATITDININTNNNTQAQQDLLQDKQQKAQLELEKASQMALKEDQAQAELEAQAIRRQAENIARKEAKKQADDEANLSQKFFPTF
ncbi:MAG: hypothetical protein OEY36_13305 [Gammaproteobacteria bacterium]|nr:hypothetical protein [Gammaproteobacteria bacterium]